MNQILHQNWLIAQIKPNSYDIAIKNLERQGFETFLPKMEITIKKKGKFINKGLPVFPGYIFVGFDPQSYSWNKINSTYGVLKVLAFNNKPSIISLSLILALKNRYEDKQEPIINKSLQKGDLIKFYNGPFVNLVANIETVDPKDRIQVLLRVLGGERKLQISLKEKINFIKI